MAPQHNTYRRHNTRALVASRATYVARRMCRRILITWTGTTYGPSGFTQQHRCREEGVLDERAESQFSMCRQGAREEKIDYTVCPTEVNALISASLSRAGRPITAACICSGDWAAAQARNARASASISASRGHLGVAPLPADSTLPGSFPSPPAAAGTPPASKCPIVARRLGRCGTACGRVSSACIRRARQRIAGAFSPSSAVSGKRSAIAGRMAESGSAVPKVTASRDKAPTALSRTTGSSSAARRCWSAVRMTCICGRTASPPLAPRIPKQKTPF
eukprot:scaffold28641_cov31-Tisochrysis_lutea.AAC.7